MASSITIEGIDTALQNLGYYTKSSPKSKFLNTIRSFYKNSEDLNKIEQIPIETIVSSIWEIAPNDKSRINSRKKNALSLKNTINKDLQKLFDSGLNSEGIIINENNIFAMSDNAREKLLTSFTAPFSGENDVSLSQISQVLSSIKDFLEKTRQKDNTQSDFQNIQSLISEIEKNFTDKSDTPGDQPGSGDKESGSAKGGGSDSYENDEVESSGKRTVTIELDEDEEIEEVFEDDTESDDTEIVEVEDEEAINTEEVTEDDLQEEFDDELTEEAEDDSDILELEDDEELIDSNEETEEAEFQEEVIDDELIEEVEDDLDEEDLVTDIDEDIIDDSDILELEDDEELIDSNEETEEAEFQEEVIDDELIEEVEDDLDEEDLVTDIDEDIIDDSDILELEDDEELIDSNEETEEAEFQEEVIDDELIEEVEDDLDEEDLVTDIDEDIIDDSDILELEDDEELIDSNEETEEAEFQEEVIDDELIEEVEDDLDEEDLVTDIDEDIIDDSDILELEDDEELIDSNEETEEAEFQEEVIDDGLIEEVEDDLDEEDFVSDTDEDTIDEPDVLELEDDEELIDSDIVEEVDDSELIEIDEDKDFEDSEEDAIELDDDEELVEADEIELGEDEELVDENEDAHRLPELGLPAESLGEFESYLESQNIDSKNLLSEKFDSYLGAMDRYYNQFLIIKKNTYKTGCPYPSSDLKPESEIDLNEFFIGAFPITNALFEIFIEKTGYKTTAEEKGFSTVFESRYKSEYDYKTGKHKSILSSTGKSTIIRGACWYQPFGPGSGLHKKRSHPVVHISLKDALSFAAWIGKRLPTEDEWEAAARTDKGFPFPWGSQWIENACNTENCGKGDTSPVDEYIEGINSNKISDTLGNAWEWTTSSIEKAEKTFYIAKGGSFVSDQRVRLWSRYFVKPDFTSNILGFRCVAD